MKQSTQLAIKASLLTFFCVLAVASFAYVFVSRQQGTQRGTVVVYRTRTGSCYHNVDCYYLSESKISISLEDAKRMGLRPCSYCDPPT